MTRMTRHIVLGLIGSAMLLSCCFVSCVDVREEEVKDEKGQVVQRRRHYYFRPWHFTSGGGGGGWSYRSGYSPAWGRSYSSPTRTTSGTPSSGSRTTSGVTSRGGFGGSVHAAS